MTSPWLQTDEDLLASCADALVRMEDGSVVPCSRYVMSACSPVLAALVDLYAPLHEGRVVVPVADTGREKYDAFVRLVHGVTRIEDLSLRECIGAFEAADFLGSDVIMDATARAAWAAAPSPKTVHALRVVPRLLALPGGDDAHDVVTHACADHPLWPDAVEDFLCPMAADLEPAALRTLAAMQRFYPPAAVAAWIMGCRHVTEDIALDLATFDEFAPAEMAAVCDGLHRLYSRMRWMNDPVTRLVETFRSCVMDTDDVPVPRVVVGHHIDFAEHRFVVSAFVPPRHKPTRAPFELSRLLRVRLPAGGGVFGFGVHAGRLRRGLGLGHRPASVQVRVTGGAAASMSEPAYDSWYVIPLDAGAEWTECGAPVAEIGHISEAMRERYDRGGFYLRFDARYGEDCVFSNPGVAGFHLPTP